MNLENINWEIRSETNQAIMYFTIGKKNGVCKGWYLDFKYIEFEGTGEDYYFEYDSLRAFAISDGKKYVPLIDIYNYFDSSLDEQVQGHKRDVAINKNHEDYTWGRI